MDQKPTESTNKLPYEPPTVLSEEVFETLALACAKDPGSDCEFSPPTKS